MEKQHNWYKGQLVFFRYLNPAIGTVTRWSTKHNWVEVKWSDGHRAARWNSSYVQPLNGVLNYWLALDSGGEMRNATVPKGDKISISKP